MGPAITLPRLVFGSGALASLAAELALLGVVRPLLISDRGLERAGLVARVVDIIGSDAVFLDVPENPTAAGVDAATAVFRGSGCDGVIAIGGGSVLDTAKIVAALGGSGSNPRAIDLIGHYDRIDTVVPLIAIPTTVGTGSDSSPVAALHRDEHGPAIGTRGPLMVPRVAILDPDLIRTLPRHLIAATAIDALSHCFEGFFAEPANPVVDALALDGMARILGEAAAALEPSGDAARASLMAAAFAGGLAIGKGIGPAHAIATNCIGDVHHGTVIAIILPHTVQLYLREFPAKAARIAAATGVAADRLGDTIAALVTRLGLPATLAAIGAVVPPLEAVVASPVNRMCPHVPTADEYAAVLAAIAG